jgi:hypothetical protein
VVVRRRARRTTTGVFDEDAIAMPRLRKRAARTPDGREFEPEDVPGYRNLRPIGQGGFSVVYRARQEAMDREVALKVVTIGLDEAVRRRFLREVSLTSRLTGHPNVVTALDSGTTRSGRPYLAMDLHDRGSLADRLAEHGPLPPAEVAKVGAKIAGALEAAHRVGVVHRDVKPNNILLSRFGEPVLADFGVACLLDDRASMTAHGAFTLRHAAPEVVNGVSPTAASDVYSLGSSLYELVCGKPAFEGGGQEMVALMHRILTEEPAPLECPGSPELARVIHRAMAKQPEDRYATAAALAADLSTPATGAMVTGSTSDGLLGTPAGAVRRHRTKPLPSERVPEVVSPWSADGDAETSVRAGRDRVPVRAEPAPGRGRTVAAVFAAVAVVAAAGAVAWLNWPSGDDTAERARPAQAAHTTTAVVKPSGRPRHTTTQPTAGRQPPQGGEVAAPPDAAAPQPATDAAGQPAKPAPPAPSTPAPTRPASASVCTPNGCAGRATFDATGEHLIVCDNKDDGFGAVARYTRSDVPGQNNDAWSREGTGKCIDHNMNMPEGARITFQVCLEDNGTRVFSCSDFRTGTS